MHGFNPGDKNAKHTGLLAVLAASGTFLTAGVASAEGAPNHVRDVRVHLEGQATEVEIFGSAEPKYNARVADGGKRLVVDLADADVVGVPAAMTSSIGVVGGVLTQSYRTGGRSIARLSINLKETASYRVRTEGSALRISLEPSEKTAADPGDGPAQRSIPHAPRASAPSVSVSDLANPLAAPSPTLTTKAKGEPQATSELKDVRFERKPGATPKDRIVLTFRGTPTYSLATTTSGRVRLALKDMKVPDALVRALDVSAFKGQLKTVTTAWDAETHSSIIEVDRVGDGHGTVAVEGQNLVWSFDVPASHAAVPAGQPSPAAGPSRRKIATIAREELADVGPKIQTSIHDGASEISIDGAEAGFASGVRGQAAGANGRFTGRRIDLDLKDADIHNVLRLLADVGRVNIITADDVAGSITIRMRNVPWDQALEVVLQSKSLGMVRSGQLIRVAPLAQLQKEREAMLAAAKAEFDLMPLETRLIPVSYAQAGELQTRAKDMLSPRGSIAVDDRTNVLIARDVAANLNHVEELVRSLDTQTPQVLIEARIVEATSRYLRDIGIQWGGDAALSEVTGNATGVAFPSRLSLAGGASDGQTPTAGLSPFQRVVPNPNFAVNLPAAAGTGQGGALGMSFGSIDNNFNVSLRLSAAEASGMVRIVSSPRILTLDNRSARINQGTLIPFAQVSAQGVQTTFQEAKLQLLVTPHVTADGSVSMHVKVNRDEPDFVQTGPRGDPTINKREAETDLLVMDGHTAVIGGIFTRNTGRSVDQVPFFGDIPILGVLFQRRRATDQRGEIVIFLTPRIVNRAESIGR